MAVADVGAGAKASGAKTTDAKFNPPFHANILKIYGQNRWDNGNAPWEVLNLHRGAIIEDGGKGRGVRFLYNPSVITLGHKTNSEQSVIPDDPANADLSQNWFSDVGGLSFSLLFDRNYEVWTGVGPGQTAKSGIMEDVRALYRLMDIQTPDSAEGFKSAEPLRPAVLTNAFFYFGQGGTTLKERSTTSPLAFFGAISSIDITIAHWSVNMIPMRCAVNLTVRLIPDKGFTLNDAAPAGGGGVTAPGGGVINSGGGGTTSGDDPGKGRDRVGGGNLPLPGPNESNQQRSSGTAPIWN